MGIRSLIVGVSACSTEQETEFIEAGLDDFQEKPLTATKLASILQKVRKDGWIYYKEKAFYNYLSLSCMWCMINSKM